jgi:hypothetical protein
VVGGVKTNWYQSIERHLIVMLPNLLVVGDITNWYQSIERCLVVTLHDLLVVGNVTNWYQSQVSSTKPGWAR